VTETPSVSKRFRFVRDIFAHPSHEEGSERYDTDQPWICWTFLSTDARTRITGRSVVLMDCCVCGQKRKVRIRIPRVGPVPDNGKHVERLRFMRDHLHPEKPHPITWAKPLRNLAVFGTGGLDLDLLAMRLEADLKEAMNG
jgi:hypothetical protein